MRLYDQLPVRIEYDGKTYKLLPWFDRVLEVVDTIRRTDMTEYSKLDYALWLLVSNKRAPRDPRLLDTVLRTLVEPVRSDTPRAIDMTQDAALIYSAFRQAYGIDLLNKRLHWWEFSALLSGLPKDTRLMEVVDIRLRPIPQATKTNGKEIQELMRLKTLYRINIPPEEAEANYQRGLTKMAQSFNL